MTAKTGLMQLSHWSDVPVSAVYSTDPTVIQAGKPRGLWVSVDGEDDWAAWCKDNEFDNLGAKIRHRVVLAEDCIWDAAAVAEVRPWEPAEAGVERAAR